MTITKLVLRSLRYHLRSHAGVVIGAAVGSAALIGALIVGDSVRGSLHEIALARLGRTELALVSNDRLVRSQLAEDLSSNSSLRIAPLLQLSGTASRADGAARANGVQILGVDDRFWLLANRPPQLGSNWSSGVILNSALAKQLNVQVNEEVLLRVQKPARLSRESPISPQQDFNVALRLPVQAVVSDDQLGRFSLRANQVPPYNAFVRLGLLQERAEASNRANLLLLPGAPNQAVSGPQPPQRLALTNAHLALQKVWRLADAGLELRSLTNFPAIELRSERVFLDPPVVDAAQTLFPDATRILTYFVNELRIGTNLTPYSMVSGLEKTVFPVDLQDQEILLSPWLADDLRAKPGDELRMSYYVVDPGRRLRTVEETFRVRGVVPLTGVFADRDLMPDFPGVAKAESSHDWDAGFPIDLSRIRDKDETYWKTYRGTPKAFITLAAAQRMWTNRFGSLTAIRFSTAEQTPAKIEQALLNRLDPAMLGLNLQPVREQALAASSQSMDFGQLFLGFSFFLIVAALVLVGLLFQFGLEQRTADVGTLLALGFNARTVRRLMLLEGGLLALLGGLLGLAGAIIYARAMLHGLTTIWRDAIGVSALSYHATPATLLAGLIASVAVAVTTIALVSRKQARRAPHELLAHGSEEFTTAASQKSKWSGPVALISAGLACGITIWMLWKHETARPEAFFAAGSLLLVAGLGAAASLLRILSRSAGAQAPTVAGLGFRNMTRRSRRSLATITLLACGSFIIVAVGANKLESDRNAAERSSGTGGFELLGESALPVVHDLNGPEGREFFGLNSNELSHVEWVSFRVRPGDDASCLNLNRAQTPRLLGVQAAMLSSRRAFSFSQIADGLPGGDPWSLLNQPLADGAIPAIADQASIQWALGKKIGDTLTYTDARGQPFQVRLVAGLANSVLQGNLIIAEQEFVRRFPDEAGYRMFLIDAPSEQRAEIITSLSRALQDVGLELVPASQRLAQFNAVQNTYLNTFQILGGLGLLLGSAGLGVVVLRNVLERRGELALLQAVGFRKRALRWLVLSEHGGLLLLGLVVGMTAAIIAILPVLLAPAARVHYLSLGVTLSAVLISGALWTILAIRLALRGELLNALRNE